MQIAKTEFTFSMKVEIREDELSDGTYRVRVYCPTPFAEVDHGWLLSVIQASDKNKARDDAVELAQKRWSFQVQKLVKHWLKYDYDSKD